MARQQVEWTPYMGAWSKGRVTSPTDTYTGDQAARWRFLQDQADRKKADRKKAGRERRRKGGRS